MTLRRAAMEAEASLTERERDVLCDLVHLADHPPVMTEVPEGWARPLDVGGRDGSHHSATLAALVRKGFAERRSRNAMWRMTRGSWVYKPTDAGRARLSASLEQEGK